MKERNFRFFSIKLKLLGIKNPFRFERILSGKRDSNSQHSAWKADALPIELFPLILNPANQIDLIQFF